MHWTIQHTGTLHTLNHQIHRTSKSTGPVNTSKWLFWHAEQLHRNHRRHHCMFKVPGTSSNTCRLHFFPFSFLGNTSKILQIHTFVQDDACQTFLTFAFHYILCKTGVSILCKTDVYTGGKKQATFLILLSSPYQEIFQVILSYKDLCHGHKPQCSLYPKLQRFLPGHKLQWSL